LSRTYLSFGDLNLAHCGLPRNSKLFETLTASISMDV
ncbi:unnamed protein product, partial [Allacma fusca]